MSNLNRWPSIKCFLPSFNSFGEAVFEKIFRNRPTRNNNCLWLLGFRGEDFFRNQPISNKNCLWWTCLFTDRDDISNLCRGPSIDATYQVSVHLAKRFQRRRFFMNWPISNKNCLCRPCLLTDPDEISNLYRGSSIDATYQVSVPWPSGFRVEDFLGIDQSATRTAYGGHVCYELSRNEQSL